MADSQGKMTHEEFFDLFFNDTEPPWLSASQLHDLTPVALVELTFFTVCCGVFLFLNLRTVSHIWQKVFRSPPGAQLLLEDSQAEQDVEKAFAKLVVVMLVGMSLSDLIDYALHIDFYCLKLLDWKRVAEGLSYFIQFLRMAKIAYVIALGCNQVLVLLGRTGTHWAWLLVALISLAGPVVMLPHVLHSSNFITEMGLVPTILGHLLFGVIYGMAKRKRMTMSKAVLLTTKITLGFLTALLAISWETVIIGILDSLFFYSYFSYVIANSILFVSYLIHFLFYPLSYLLFSVGFKGYDKRIFHSLNDPVGVGEPVAFMRGSESQLTGLSFPKHISRGTQPYSEDLVNFSINEADDGTEMPSSAIDSGSRRTT